MPEISKACAVGWKGKAPDPDPDPALSLSIAGAQKAFVPRLAKPLALSASYKLARDEFYFLL
jgi:hypothetical protein